jgi:type IV pilus assembly protein PilA
LLWDFPQKNVSRPAHYSIEKDHLMISRMMGELSARRNSLQEKEKGFTLIELLVVIVIIGILAAIAIPVYMGVQDNAKNSAVKSDVANAKTAVVASYTDLNAMPGDLTGLSSYGYSVPTKDPNYKNLTTDLPTLSKAVSGTGFAICATSTTGKIFGASDTSGVAEGTCLAGVFAPK